MRPSKPSSRSVSAAFAPAIPRPRSRTSCQPWSPPVGAGGYARGMPPVLPTTVIGSYPQPDWLIDRERLRGSLPPRVRARELWRGPQPVLAGGPDDAPAPAVARHGRARGGIGTHRGNPPERYSHPLAAPPAGPG